MPLTRSKRVSEDPLLTLSAVKFSKRRRVESPPHVCSPRCYKLNSPCPFGKGEITFEETEDEEEDVLNISDQNENEVDVSAELESIDGDDELNFEEVVQEEQEEVVKKITKNPRSKKS